MVEPLTIAGGLLLAFLIGLVRAFKGPSAGDRLLSLMLLGSTGIATLLILSVDDIGPGLLDAALALAVLAPVSTAAFLVSRQAVRDRTRGSHVE